MARQADPMAPYILRIQKVGKTNYAVTRSAVADPKTGKKKYRTIRWGRLEEGLRFIPGRNFFTDEEERIKLLYPKNWDLSEIAGYFDYGDDEEDEDDGGSDSMDDDYSFRGHDDIDEDDEEEEGDEDDAGMREHRADIWLLDSCADGTGIREDIAYVLGDDLAQAYITLAMYILREKGLFGDSGFEVAGSWQSYTSVPYRRRLSPEHILRIMRSVSQNDLLAIMRRRTERLRKGNEKDRQLCIVEREGRLPRYNFTDDLYYGGDDDDEDWRRPPTVLEGIAYSAWTAMPVGCFPVERGWSPKNLLDELSRFSEGAPILITWRGFDSLDDLLGRIDENQPFITSASIHQPCVQKKIRELGTDGRKPAGMDFNYPKKLFYGQYDLEHDCAKGGRRKFKLNIYFDPLSRANSLADIDESVKLQKESLDAILAGEGLLGSKRMNERNYSFYNLDYTGDESEGTLWIEGYHADEKKIEERKAAAGYYAVISSGVEGRAGDILEKFDLPEHQEKYFELLNNALMSLDAETCKGWKGGFDGRCGQLLIVFAALTLGSYIDYAMKWNRDWYLIDTALDAMRVMSRSRYSEYEGKARRERSMQGEQMTILDALGLRAPKDFAAPPGGAGVRKLLPWPPGQ